MKALIEQAARILDHEPTRSMELASLHRRAARESGDAEPRPAFLEALGKAPDRFAVIETGPAETSDNWDQRQRALYRSALESVGALETIVVLIEPRTPLAGPEDRAGDTGDILSDVHDALALLLRSAEGDDSLHAALSAAVGEMQVLRRYLLPKTLSDGAA